MWAAESDVVTALSSPNRAATEILETRMSTAGHLDVALSVREIFTAEDPLREGVGTVAGVLAGAGAVALTRSYVSGEVAGVVTEQAAKALYDLTHAGLRAADEMLREIDRVYRDSIIYEHRDPFGRYFANPIVIDLDGDGIELRGAFEQNVRYDVDGDGTVDRIGWVGADDGLLAMDFNGDGRIDRVDEFQLTAHVETAPTDLAALAVFDRDDDGKISAADSIWQRMYVFRDANSNGRSDVGELKRLSEWGMSSVSLSYREGMASTYDYGSGNVIYGFSSAGSRLIADTAFAIAGRSAIDGEAILERSEEIDGGGANDRLVGLGGNDTISGLGSNDILAGDGGNDTIYGGPGDDTLVGGAGSDKLSGGGGNDWYIAAELSASTDTILDFSTIGDHLDLRAVTSSIGDVTLTRMDSNTWRVRVDDQTILIETPANLTVGSTATDDIIVAATTGSGTAGDDNMVGNSAANSFNGGAGDDTIRGGGGNDTLLGASGDDTLQGQDADDLMQGGEGNDILVGAGGDDWADGGTGFDGVFGGDGDDVLYGGDDQDTIVGEAGGDELRGGGGNDDLDGGADGDLLLGHDGNDSLAGGLGNDIMTGAAGVDRFVVNRNEGVDRITDFVTGQDELDLRDCGFTSVAQLRALAVAVAGGILIDLPGTGTLTVLGLDTPSDLVSGDLLL